MASPSSNSSLSRNPDQLPVSGQIDWGKKLEVHGADVRKTLRGLLVGEDDGVVEDLFQEVTLATQSGSAGEVTPGKEQAWLRQVAANKTKDYWRKKTRKKSLEDRYASETELAKPNEKSPYEWVLALETSELIEKALLQMSPTDRMIITQKYLKGQTCRQIAEGGGFTEKAVEHRLAKAKKSMRTLLKKLTQNHSEA